MSAAALTVEPRGAMAPAITSFAFTEENERKATEILAKYPGRFKASAVLPILHLAQEQHGGWLPRPILDFVADFLGMPKIKVYEVASFYDMYNTVPVGRVQVRACTTTPCWLCGSDEVVRACRDVLGVEPGESTEDGRFFFREFECLGACANAPILWVEELIYEDLDYDSTKRILESLKRGEVPPAGSVKGRKASMPIGGKTTLHEVVEVEVPQPESWAERDQVGIEKGRPDEEVVENAKHVAEKGRPADEEGEPVRREKDKAADAD